MATAGKRVVNADGKIGVLSGGKAAVADSSGNCATCCGVYELKNCENDADVIYSDDANTDFSAVAETTWEDYVGPGGKSNGKVAEIAGVCRVANEISGPVGAVVVDETHAACSDCLVGSPCGDCTFDMSKDLIIDLKFWTCQYGTSDCTGPIFEFVWDRIWGTIQPTAETGKWSGTVNRDEGLDATERAECLERSWVTGATEIIELKWDCIQNRWELEFSEAFAFPVIKDDGDNDDFAPFTNADRTTIVTGTCSGMNHFSTFCNGLSAALFRTHDFSIEIEA